MNTETLIASILIKKGLTIAIAESCTGGLITSRLVSCPGISAVLKESVVAYSNESKVKRLGVNPETINEFGAVSAQTAQEMASGIAETAETQIGLSATGVAGPGASEKKPVGLVYIGLSIQGRVFSREFKFAGGRDEIRNQSVSAALDILLGELSAL